VACIKIIISISNIFHAPSLISSSGIWSAPVNLCILTFQ
jgi:hypothetical protein